MLRSPAGRPGHAPPAHASTWTRRRKLLAAAPIALVLALAIGAAVAGLGAGRASRPAVLPEVTASTKGARWLAGPASRLLKAVYADLGRVSASARSGQGGVAKTAGPRLAADAGAALGGPMPPVDARTYRSALKALKKAGWFAARGEFSKADALLNAGGNDMTKVTAAVNNPAKVSAPAAVNEPAGQ